MNQIARFLCECTGTMKACKEFKAGVVKIKSRPWHLYLYMHGHIPSIP